jgi:hypothetical protein
LDPVSTALGNDASPQWLSWEPRFCSEKLWADDSDDENQEACGRAKKATNQKQEADLFSGLSPPMEKTHDYYWR